MSYLYIHIPFCISKCFYCTFVSFPSMSHLFERYVTALGKELRSLAIADPETHLETVFLGGGTPSLLPVEMLEKIFRYIDDVFERDKNTEISMEMNPKTVDFNKVLTVKQLGVNRISLGIQSFVDTELQCLGRLHTAQQGWESAELVKAAGFANFNLDLISGVPGQTVDSWEFSLQTAQELDPKHLALYQLGIEEGSIFHDWHSRGKLCLPIEDQILEMDRVSESHCSRVGLVQYEISNFAKHGYECRHNINYWENREYFGVGAGAVSYRDGVRIKNVDDPQRYCSLLDQNDSVVQETEKLDDEASFRESVVMALRMARGASIRTLADRYGIDVVRYYGDTLKKLMDQALVEFDEPYLRLTARGRRLANRVMSELV